MHDPRAWLCRLRVWTFRWRRDQRLDKLVSEADNLVRAHVATDHAVGQSWLEGLIDNASFIGEIRFALFHELAERHILGHAAAARVKYPNNRGVVGGCGHQFNLPHALTAIAAALFEHPRACRSKPHRK